MVKFNVFKKADIAKVYTAKVAELLADGYVFSFTNRGNQGEETKADFTNDNGKTVIRILVCEDSEILNETKWHERADTLVVEARRYDNADQLPTIWNNKGEVIWQKVYYCLGNRYDCNAFTDSKEAVVAITKLREERFENRKATIYSLDGIRLPLTLAKPALKIIRKQRGYKTVKVSDINRICRKTEGYLVYITGKYPIWIKSPITVAHK